MNFAHAESIPRFAHRGASGYEPENTLRSFERAMELGADAIECDVRLTKDDVPIVFHDFYLNRITNASGLVRSKTYEEIKSLRVLGSDETIPTLRDVLDFVKNRTRAFIELKQGNLARHVVPLVKEFDMIDNVTFQSFNHSEVSRISRFDPQASIGLLFSRITRWFFRAPYILQRGILFRANSIMLHHRLVSKGLVKFLHGAGFDVYSCVVNTPEEARQMEGAGVDGIFTDYPDKI